MSRNLPALNTAEFICPREGDSTRHGEYYLSLGRDKKKRLLAIITKGHPNIVGEANTTICDVEVVKDRDAAAVWFGKALILKPWESRS